MMEILTNEQLKEQDREKKLEACEDAIEKQEYEAKFSVERSKAQKRIEKTMARHKSEINKLKKKFKS